MVELRIKTPFPKVIFRGPFTVKLYTRIEEYVRRSDRTVEIWKRGITGSYLFEITPQKVRRYDEEQALSLIHI